MSKPVIVTVSADERPDPGTCQYVILFCARDSTGKPYPEDGQWVTGPFPSEQAANDWWSGQELWDQCHMGVLPIAEPEDEE